MDINYLYHMLDKPANIFIALEHAEKSFNLIHIISQIPDFLTHRYDSDSFTKSWNTSLTHDQIYMTRAAMLGILTFITFTNMIDMPFIANFTPLTMWGFYLSMFYIWFSIYAQNFTYKPQN